MLKKLGIVWDDYRFWLHVPIGAGIVLVEPPTHWVVSLSFMLLFLAYEITEDWRLKDGAYIDIQGAIGGIIFAAIGCWLWGLII